MKNTLFRISLSKIINPIDNEKIHSPFKINSPIDNQKIHSFGYLHSK
jgi:hypothetical protein